MNILLNNNVLNSIDVLPYLEKLPHFGAVSQFIRFSGQEVYRLLIYLSNQFNKGSKFIDIGTNSGMSAIAMAGDLENYVISFDIRERQYFIEEQVRSGGGPLIGIQYFDNIDFVIGNFNNFICNVLRSQIIYLDMNMGDQEANFIKILKTNNWKGILIMDDIYYWPKITEIWNNIKDLNKIDITKYGHYSGTGLINFSEDIKFILE